MAWFCWFDPVIVFVSMIFWQLLHFLDTRNVVDTSVYIRSISSAIPVNDDVRNGQKQRSFEGEINIGIKIQDKNNLSRFLLRTSFDKFQICARLRNFLKKTYWTCFSFLWGFEFPTGLTRLISLKTRSSFLRTNDPEFSILTLFRSFGCNRKRSCPFLLSKIIRSYKRNSNEK